MNSVELVSQVASIVPVYNLAFDILSITTLFILNMLLKTKPSSDKGYSLIDLMNSTQVVGPISKIQNLLVGMISQVSLQSLSFAEPMGADGFITFQYLSTIRECLLLMVVSHLGAQCSVEVLL